MKNFALWLRLELLRKNRHSARRLSPIARLSVNRSRKSAARISHLSRFSGRGAYLEIGVQKGFTLEAVPFRRSVGVDPSPQVFLQAMPRRLTLHKKTSDEFFASADQQAPKRFNFIFLDGLHTFSQTYKDLCNASALLEPGGIILIDDVYPSDEPSSLPNQARSVEAKQRSGISHRRWYGDVWRLLPFLTEELSGWDCVLMGLGGEDHCQAVIFRTENTASKLSFSPDRLEQMSLLEYGDVVESAKLQSKLVVDHDAFAQVSDGIAAAKAAVIA